MGGNKEEGAILFSAVPTDCIRGNEHKLKTHDILSEHKKKHFHCEGDQTLEGIACRHCEVSVCGDIKNLMEHGPGQPAVGSPVWAGEDGLEDL